MVNDTRIEVLLALTGFIVFVLGGLLLGPQQPIRVALGSGLMIGGALMISVTLPFIFDEKI